MNASVSIRGYRAGFLFAVVLLAAASAFALWSERRTNLRTNVLVQHALERAALIGRIRVDAVSLESAVGEHIDAPDEATRDAADEGMEDVLEDIRLAVSDYTDDLPQGERAIWTRFKEKCEALAEQVRTARRYSKRREAEQARLALEERIRPLIAELDSLAAQLSQENADLTRELLSHAEALRVRSSVVGALVTVLAVVLSVIVGLRVTRLLRQYEQTIQAQLEELDRRNRELDSFASRVAHDLVSPLGPARGYLTLLRRAPNALGKEDREMLEHVDDAVRRASGLVEALLRFCRAGQQGDSQVSDLDTAVGTVLLEVDQVAALQKVALVRKMGSPLPVPVSHSLLQSVAQNLLSNAVKYTAGRPDAKVEVRLSQKDSWAVLEVVDNGMGMTPEEQSSLFQPFFRGSAARALPGHGLGLATTRRIIEAYGGTIRVQSTLGLGTTVTVRLPLAAPPSATSKVA